LEGCREANRNVVPFVNLGEELARAVKEIIGSDRFSLVGSFQSAEELLEASVKAVNEFCPKEGLGLEPFVVEGRHATPTFRLEDVG
jgi:hypothetical protein